MENVVFITRFLTLLQSLVPEMGSRGAKSEQSQRLRASTDIEALEEPIHVRAVYVSGSVDVCQPGITQREYSRTGGRIDQCREEWVDVGPAWYAPRKRPPDEVFPWSHLRGGRPSDYVLRQYDDAFTQINVPKPQTEGATQVSAWAVPRNCAEPWALARANSRCRQALALREMWHTRTGSVLDCPTSAGTSSRGVGLGLRVALGADL